MLASGRGARLSADRRLEGMAGSWTSILTHHRGPWLGSLRCYSVLVVRLLRRRQKRHNGAGWYSSLHKKISFFYPPSERVQWEADVGRTVPHCGPVELVVSCSCFVYGNAEKVVSVEHGPTTRSGGGPPLAGSRSGASWSRGQSLRNWKLSSFYTSDETAGNYLPPFYLHPWFK